MKRNPVPPIQLTRSELLWLREYLSAVIDFRFVYRGKSFHRFVRSVREKAHRHILATAEDRP